MTDEHVLGADLTIYSVAHWAERCRLWVMDLDGAAGDLPLQVQADRVEEVDGAGVQLLLALSRSLEQRGRRLALLRPSPVLLKALQRLGAGDLVVQQLAQEVGA